MRRIMLVAWTAAVALAISGCASGPLQDNPALIQLDPNTVVENPVYVALGPTGYGTVFEKVLDVVDDYFEIAYTNRYDGRIECFPRITPGLEQPWKPGNPGVESRLHATLQTLRHRAFVLIQPAEDGGFFVQVTVFKELEDLARPIRATAGAAAFRSDNSVERQTEVIDPTVLDSNWIPLGRDRNLEQLILQRIHRCM